MDITTLLRSYPRARPLLTQQHQRVYEDQYLLNRDGSKPIESLAQRLEQWMHRRVANNISEPILELGAGTLNHLGYEPKGAVYDVVEPFHNLYRGRKEVPLIRDFFDSVQAIPADRKYSRVISVAVLEHMEALPLDVAHSALHLTENGLFQAGIPSEGGILWWLGWRFTTGISYYMRTRLDYGVVMRHEHLNSAPEIAAVLNYLFADVKISRFPLPWHHASFYAYVEARGPIRERCRQVLEDSQS